jgi:hypothetical protein
MPYLGRQKPTETTANVLRSTYTGNGSTTTYNLPGPVANETAIIATINGVTQQDSAYTTNGTQIIFAAAPALNDAIELRTISAVAMSYTPPDGSVVTGKIADLAVTTGKIADSSITTAKIAAGAVVQADIGTNVAGTGPAFSARKDGTQAISQNTTTKITYDIEVFDTDNSFSSSRFTPTVAGYYQVNLTASIETTSGDRYLQVFIFKNGTTIITAQPFYGSSAGANGMGAVLSGLVYLNGSTDYIESYAVTNSTTTILNNTFNNTFSACLVRAA